VTLTPEDLELMRRPLYGYFTVAAGADPPQPRPVWFEATDDGTVGAAPAHRSPRVAGGGRTGG
jgi:hypothetical protein